MSEPTYLWNLYGTRRHIAKGDGMPCSDYSRETVCKQFHYDRFWQVDRIQRHHGRFANECIGAKVAKLDTLPLCKHCERAWAKTEPAS